MSIVDDRYPQSEITTHFGFKEFFSTVFELIFVKGCSHGQVALGLCSAISPLPGMLRANILAISSLIFVLKGQTKSRVGRAIGVKPVKPPEELSALRAGHETILQVHCPHSSPDLTVTTWN